MALTRVIRPYVWPDERGQKAKAKLADGGLKAFKTQEYPKNDKKTDLASFPRKGMDQDSLWSLDQMIQRRTAPPVSDNALICCLQMRMMIIY